MADIVNY